MAQLLHRMLQRISDINTYQTLVSAHSLPCELYVLAESQQVPRCGSSQ